MWWRKALDGEEWRKLQMQAKSCRAEDDEETKNK
jgi:hypothetical protein